MQDVKASATKRILTLSKAETSKGLLQLISFYRIGQIV